MKLEYRDIEWFLEDFERGRYPNQRLGQAFLNAFQIECPHKSNENALCLFGEENDGRAKHYIWESYLV